MNLSSFLLHFEKSVCICMGGFLFWLIAEKNAKYKVNNGIKTLWTLNSGALAAQIEMMTVCGTEEGKLVSSLLAKFMPYPCRVWQQQLTSVSPLDNQNDKQGRLSTKINFFLLRSLSISICFAVFRPAKRFKPFTFWIDCFRPLATLKRKPCNQILPVNVVY